MANSRKYALNQVIAVALSIAGVNLAFDALYKKVYGVGD